MPRESEQRHKEVDLSRWPANAGSATDGTVGLASSIAERWLMYGHSVRILIFVLVLVVIVVV